MSELLMTNPNDICVHACQSCCCRAGVGIELYPHEADILAQAGTSMHYDGFNEVHVDTINQTYAWYINQGMSHIQAIAAIKEGFPAVYILMSDCGYLGPDGLCNIYYDSSRPEACHHTNPGACNDIRGRHGYNPVRLRNDGYAVPITDVRVNN